MHPKILRTCSTISCSGTLRRLMRNIKLLLSYDGTDFSGWQRQPDRRTVQQVLEEAIGRLTGVEPRDERQRPDRRGGPRRRPGRPLLHGRRGTRPRSSSRRSTRCCPPTSGSRGAWEMPQSFHATLDAKAKLYRYVIDNGRIADPFQTRYSLTRLPAARRRRDAPRGAGPDRAGTTSTASRPTGPTARAASARSRTSRSAG